VLTLPAPRVSKRKLASPFTASLHVDWIAMSFGSFFSRRIECPGLSFLFCGPRRRCFPFHVGILNGHLVVDACNAGNPPDSFVDKGFILCG